MIWTKVPAVKCVVAPSFSSLGQWTRASSTIFALSSGHGKCGVAVIRVTGPSSSKALAALTEPSKLPSPRLAAVRTLRHPKTRLPLDHALTLWFPGPKSFTGEDSAELQVHGGLAVVNAVLSALGSLDDLRPAEPGEFTRRAFHAGKLDLTQVEGLGDLIHAETEAQRSQAMRQLGGSLFQTYSEWRRRLIKQVANIEAFIDFSESEEIEDGVPEEVAGAVATLADEMESHLADARAGERLRSGVRVAIVGEPNVGKSTLLNLLAQRPAAIVSPIAGTTRDVIETCLDVGGYPVVVVDTAGLRAETDDPIEREGIARAAENARNADLVVLVMDAERVGTDDKCDVKTIGERARDTLTEFGLENQAGKRLIFVNKIDLFASGDEGERLSPPNGDNCPPDMSFISCKTNAGVESALAKMKTAVAELCSTSLGESPLLTRQRHRLHVERALANLREYLEAVGGEDEADYAVAGQFLRGAIREVGQLSGKVSSEQILDVIFADFCIGK